MAGNGLEDEGGKPQGGLSSMEGCASDQRKREAGTSGRSREDGVVGGERRFVIAHGRAWLAAPYQPDAELPPGADVIEEQAEAGPVAVAAQSSHGAPRAPAMRQVQAKPREVEVRDLKAERAGRVFPCMQDGQQYTGCIGYDACKVLCWSPRPREREAVVRVEKSTGGPCRDCVYAREVRGEVAVLNGRPTRLMECRLGYWHGRATVHDFVFNRIALNVGLPCPGYIETDVPHPAVARMRETARRRKIKLLVEEETEEGRA